MPRKWLPCRFCGLRVRRRRIVGAVRADQHELGAVGCEPTPPVFYFRSRRPAVQYLPIVARMLTVFS